MKKDLGHLFISPESSHFLYKADFEQYLFNVGLISIRSNNYIIIHDSLLMKPFRVPMQSTMSLHILVVLVYLPLFWDIATR